MTNDITVSDKDLTRFFLTGIIFFIIGAIAILYLIIIIVSDVRTNIFLFGVSIGFGIFATPLGLYNIILYVVAPQKAKKMIAKKKARKEARKKNL